MRDPVRPVSAQPGLEYLVAYAERAERSGYDGVAVLVPARATRDESVATIAALASEPLDRREGK